MFVSAVVPLPDGNERVKYFLLHNGSDTSNCGRSIDSACASLLHVLMLYFAKPPTKGLEIITDHSLLIDEKMNVSFQMQVDFMT